MPTGNTLPPQSTAFIGRQTEIAEILAQFQKPDCRLLTLMGPGGIGKTRLALAIARQQADRFAHGVTFVPLTAVQRADEIATAIINSLGIHLGDSSSTPQAALKQYLRGREVLLVLDNLEHLLDGMEVLVALLHEAPGLKFLVTSREMLNLQEEWVWPVQGLRFPKDPIDTPIDLNTYGALHLFTERAQRVQHNFSLDDHLDCAIRICQLVDGMPLALELAASWLKTLSCAEIVTEIQHSIDILATNMRNIAERHRSIRTVFDHSWAMCSPAEQAVFRKLSVFHDGFEREAAEAVAGASLPILAALVEKSMIWKVPSGRYRVHQLLHQYAEEQLTTSGEMQAIQDAHMTYFSNFLHDHTVNIKGRYQLDGLNAIDADLGNIRLTWNHAVKQADTAALEAMMEGLALFCDMRARYQLGEGLLRNAMHTLADVDTPAWNRLRARWIQVWILQERKPLPLSIREALDETLHIARDSDDQMTAALCLWSLGELNRFHQQGEHRIPAYQLPRRKQRGLQLPAIEQTPRMAH